MAVPTHSSDIGVLGSPRVASCSPTMRSPSLSPSATMQSSTFGHSVSASRAMSSFAHLRRVVDLARIAWDPRRCHRLLRDAVEMLGADSDFPKAARHAEPGDEALEHVGSVLAGLSHRRGYQGLPFGIVRFVPAHH